jgi:hypothetical protein
MKRANVNKDIPKRIWIISDWILYADTMFFLNIYLQSTKQSLQMKWSGFQNHCGSILKKQIGNIKW